MFRRIMAFLISVAVAIALASIAHSLVIQSAWTLAASHADGAGPVALSIADRLSWIWHDLVGMETNDVPFGAAVAPALFLGLMIAGQVSRFVGLRTLAYSSAGAVSIFAMFMAIKATQGTIGLAGARSVFGMSVQVAIGALAGLMFARLTSSREL